LGRAGSEFYSGIQPAMFVAPISSLVTKRTSLQRKSASGVFALLLASLLFAAPGQVKSQDATPSFDDLAARAAAARDQQNIPLAIELYGKAEQLKPDWAEGWFYLGLLQYEGNQFPEAIEAFNRLLQLQPTAAPAMALRGLCEFETADYDDSLRDLEHAFAHGAANEPRNAQIIRFHLAQVLAHAGRFQDSLDQYKFFATKKLDAPDLLLGVGLAGMRVATLPKDVPASDRELYQAAGEAGYALLAGESERGDALFRQLFARYPSTPNLHLFYGFLLFPHDPLLAVDEFRSEATFVPPNETAHAMLAFSLMIAGRYTEALPEAEHAYSVAPDMEMAQLALGRSLAETGDVKRGTELLNQVLQKDPENLEAHLGLVSIYSRTGRREDANRERQLCLGLPK
jgi:tetratricopeptide (TPR) repeat protein